SLVAVRIPAAPSGFDITRVAGYRLTMVNRGASQLLDQGEFRWACVTLDSLTAYPSTTVVPAVLSTRGTVYDIHGVAGTHYAPVSVTAQSAPTAGSATAITATGPGSYTVPSGTLYVGATCQAPGGPGATVTSAGLGGGGGGGETSAEPQLPGSSAGVVIPYNVGAGSGPGTASQQTTFGPVPGQSLAVVANPGQPATANSPAGAPGGDGSVNTSHYPGGAGRTASGGLGGGGGSGAGTAAAGNTPAGTLSQVYTSSGSVTIPSGAGPVTITLTGAAGGAAGGQYGAGGGGGGCLVVVLSLPAGTYPFTVGTGGLNGGSGSNGSPGGDTSITIGGTTYTAHGGRGGTQSFFGGQGGDGGQGSAGEQPGGSGGDGYPYGGGGGSSAGPGQPGNDGNSYGQPGIAPTGGGNGGNGSGPHATSGQAGQAPGGGGGGAAQSGHAGGAGADGQVRFAYSGSGAPTAAGGVAPAGGGNGGGGGATAGTGGSAGAQPGGGGGGANSAGTSEPGGRGGDGKITITPYVNAQFPTLLLHRPGLGAPTRLSPLINLGGAAPGTTEFPVPPITARAQAWGFEDGTTSSFAGIGAAVTNSAAWASTGTRSLLVTADGTNPGGQWG